MRFSEMAWAYQQDLLDLMADKARREIQDREDKRFIKEVTMSVQKQLSSTLDEGAVRTTMKKMKKADLVEHLVRALKVQVEQDNVINGMRDGVRQRDEELKRAHELLEFWRTKAFEFQKQVNDLMKLIEPNDYV